MNTALHIMAANCTAIHQVPLVSIRRLTRALDAAIPEWIHTEYDAIMTVIMKL